MTTTTTAAAELTAPLPERPACADDPALWDSKRLDDHQRAAHGCLDCSAALACRLIGQTERGTGTFGGVLLDRGAPVIRKGLL